MKIVSFLAWEEEGMIQSRQKKQYVQEPDGSLIYPIEEVKEDQCGRRKEQQEMRSKGGRERSGQIT